MIRDHVYNYNTYIIEIKEAQLIIQEIKIPRFYSGFKKTEVWHKIKRYIDIETKGKGVNEKRIQTEFQTSLIALCMLACETRFQTT